MNQQNVNISDEQLSAFLDAELPEAEMELIREQLIEDENLANRLADLAIVDQVVAASYASIDTRPLPKAVTQLLAEEKTTAKIIAFPVLKKFQENIQRNIAIAASFAFVVAFGITQLPTQGSGEWQSIANILEHNASGVEQLSSEGIYIKPRLTFINKAGDYCRQFAMTDKESASENIACRTKGSWKLSESVAVEKIQNSGEYQTASGGSVLDEKIEQMASGDFFDAQAESAAINQHWVK
ncbi:hypothetical protein GCM10011613_30200 [Cellvibrio zantedeschiae]|uniref:Anti sigma-E protein RseA N-terminal domain-containing protein n=1 Tax=Cellvibrio zantedeschiae TaxID=1237077 RepID=A0ABQ3B8E9_9GAMM|nr:hypothetical protein [Cellvibrio zantedeschiae]GGY83279.1 hypothetical protein GCM10011613_30200 [Cellvibrio zantedeschiae]